MFVVSEPDGWRRCPVCASPINNVVTIMELTAEHIVGPEAIPDGARFAF